MIEAGSTHPGAPEPEPALGGKLCFCGCGRPITGLRARARNALGRRMSLDLAMFRIALDEGIVTEGAADLEAFAAEGAPHIERLRSNLHGQLSRSDMDKEAIVSWSKRSSDPRDVLLKRTLEVGWACDSGDPFNVIYGGRRVAATIVEVEDTQSTVNDRPRLWVTVEARPVDGRPFTLRKRFTFSRGALPRLGDAVDVAYDPADPNDFAYRPARKPTPSAAPDERAPEREPDRIARLKDLAELHDAGALTASEFESEKQRLLNS